MAANKSKKSRMKKEDRKSQIYWADGARDSILRPHIAKYAQALQEGWRHERDYLRIVENEYHTRISWRLKDCEEPPLPLAPYDPNAPAVEETLTTEEAEHKAARIKELNDRIRRWMKYRARKLCKNFQLTNPKKNPYAVLLAKMSGVTNPPKARQGYQQFMHEHYQEKIDPEVKRRWAKRLLEEGNAFSKKTPTTGFRATVARELFKALLSKEQAGYKARAQAEAAIAKEAYDEALAKTPARTRESASRAIEALPSVLAPLLQGFCDITNLKFAIIYGGPNPRQGGEVMTEVLTYGTSATNLPMTWPQWNPQRFDKVIDFFTEWLYTAYTPAEILEAKMAEPVPPISDKELLSFDNENIDGFDAFGEGESKSDSSDDEGEWPELDVDRGVGDKEKSDNTQKKRSRDDGMTTEANVSKKHKGDRPLPSSTSSGQAQSESATDPANPGYSPYPLNPNEPLVLPNWSDQAQVHAYVQAQIQRESQLRSPSLPAPLPEPSSSSHPIPAATASPPSVPEPSLPIPTSPAISPPSAPPLILPPSPTALPASPVSPGAEANDWAMDEDMQPMDGDVQPMEEDSHPMEPNNQGCQRHSDPVLVPASFPTGNHLPPLPLPMSFVQQAAADQHTAGISRRQNTDATTSHETRAPASTPRLSNPPLSQSSPPTSASLLPSPLVEETADQTRGSLTKPSKPLSTRSRAIIPMPLCPTSAPTWFQDAYAGLTAIDLNDTNYSSLLQDYMALETAYAFTTSKPTMTIGKKNRPAILGSWIAGQRWRRKNQPVVKDPMSFSSTWSLWYSTLIPKWDHVTDRARKPKQFPYNEDQWVSLRIPGPNGMLSLVVVLYWWRCAIQGHVHRVSLLQPWEAAVSEVRQLIGGLNKLESHLKKSRT